jgi:hypothetical protein
MDFLGPWIQWEKCSWPKGTKKLDHPGLGNTVLIVRFMFFFKCANKTSGSNAKKWKQFTVDVKVDILKDVNSGFPEVVIEILLMSHIPAQYFYLVNSSCLCNMLDVKSWPSRS